MRRSSHFPLQNNNQVSLLKDNSTQQTNSPSVLLESVLDLAPSTIIHTHAVQKQGSNLSSTNHNMVIQIAEHQTQGHATK